MCHAADLIERYVAGKDGHRPHLLSKAFSEDAALKMRVQTKDIVFPPEANGIEAISKVVCRDLHQRFENIYTFCFSPRPTIVDSLFSCGWLVIMSERDGGAIRVGGGRYDWAFTDDRTQVASLTITVSQMGTLSKELIAPVMHWVQQRGYPWIDRFEAEEAARSLPPLREELLQLRMANEDLV